MPVGAEVLGDGTIGGEEALGVARRLKPLHAALPLAGRLVRILRAIIKIPVLTMFHPGEDLPLGSSRALEFVGDDHARDVGQAFTELAKELLGGSLVPTALDQDIQDVALLIDRPPQIVTFALDRQKYFIHLPLVTRPGAAAPELIGIVLSELAAPLANGFIGHAHAAFQQQLFNIAEAQAEVEVQPHRMAEDLYRKAVVLLVLSGRWCVHVATLTHCVGAQQVDNALVNYK